MVPGSLIPIRDDNPTRRFAYLTAALIALNSVLLLLEPSLGQGSSPALAEFFFRWGLIPTEITSGHPVALEICSGVCIPGKNVYLSLLTSMFLHGGLLHLGGNMLFMWVFGNNIEDNLGPVRFMVFYLLAGVAAGLAHALFNPQSPIPTVGASGAVSGLLGAYIVLYPRARVTTVLPLWIFLRFIELPAFVVLGIWFGMQFLTGAGQQLGSGGVAWMAHVGGFVAGAALIYPFGGRPGRHRGGPAPLEHQF